MIHKSLLYSVVLLLLTAVCLRPAPADIVLPKIFCDHMVLQRNAEVPVWGQAEPGQKVTVDFRGKKHRVVATAAGTWEVVLMTGDAGGPFHIEITAEGSAAKVLVTDVLVGDVWLCAGQSNMHWPVSSAMNAKAEIENSKDFPTLRLFTVEHTVAAKPMAEFEKTIPWQVCSPDSVPGFSAVGYFFGRELTRQLNSLPVGLINSSVGATPCEAWTSQKSLESKPSLAPLLEYWKGTGQPNTIGRPSVLFNGMIAPLKKFPIRGVIWYQGEANVGRGAQYSTLLPTLIEDWRANFGQPKLPFLYVQLPPFRYETETPEALAEVWDAQLRTLRSVDATWMATTSDVGDIQNLHPQNKQEIGRRLAVAALGSVYRQQLPAKKSPEDCHGPVFEAMEVTGSRIRVRFRGAKSGLLKRKGARSLDQFMICGPDKKFVPASATIVDGAVEVSAVNVAEPVAVRYCWTDTAIPNLVNGAGLPAAPFRTDDFPLVSRDRDF